MKKILTTAIILLASLQLFAQENPLYTLYQGYQNYYINPAVAGSMADSPVRMMVRRQWARFDGAPALYALGFHTRVVKGKKYGMFRKAGHGIGGNLFTETEGPVRLTGLQMTYAYHLPLSNGYQLGFGLSAMVSQYGIDHSKLIYGDGASTLDPAMIDEGEKHFIPDADFGIYYYNPEGRFWAGFSAKQLVRSIVKFDDQGIANNSLAREFNIIAGYKAIQGDNFVLEPSLNINARLSSPFETRFDVNLRGYLTSLLKRYQEERIIFDFSFRTKTAVIGGITFEMGNVYLGYYYEYPLSKIYQYSGGSHQILLGFNIERY